MIYNDDDDDDDDRPTETGRETARESVAPLPRGAAYYESARAHERSQDAIALQ